MKQNKKMDVKRKRGDIIWVDLGQHPRRHIQSGRRPCLIVNTNKSRANVYTVMPGTCNEERDGFPVHVTVEPSHIIGGIRKRTIFMAEQLVTVDEEDVIYSAGKIDRNTDVMERINEALIRQLQLEITQNEGEQFNG